MAWRLAKSRVRTLGCVLIVRRTWRGQSRSGTSAFFVWRACRIMKCANRRAEQLCLQPQCSAPLTAIHLLHAACNGQPRPDHFFDSCTPACGCDNDYQCEPTTAPGQPPGAYICGKPPSPGRGSPTVASQRKGRVTAAAALAVMS